MRLLVLWLLATTSIASATPVYEDDPAHEPYLMALGPHALLDRADGLAALAERVADPARRARYLAVACANRSAALFEATLSAPECKRAAELAAKHALLDVEVALLTIRGHSLAWQVDVAGSIAALQQAIERGRSLTGELAQPRHRAEFTLHAIALEAGQYDAAIAGLDGVRRASVEVGNLEMEGWALLWTCRAYTKVSEYARAREYCLRGRAIADRTRDHDMHRNVEWLTGELESSMERHEQALRHFDTAWRLSQGRGFDGFQPTLMLTIIYEYLALGRLEEAATWQRMVEASPMASTYAPQVALYRGRLALARNDLAAAVEALELATASRSHSVAINARYELSAAHKARGDRGAARAALEDAIRRIETDRSAIGPDQRAAFMNLHALAYRALVILLWDELGPAGATRALEVAEAGRARSLLDAVAMTGSRGVAAPPRTAAQIVDDLPEDAALIEYVSLDRTFAIAATRAGVVIVPLPGADAHQVLARRVSFFRQLVAESADDADLVVPARRLHADLMAPVLAALPDGGRGITTLVISPDGPLHGLPWDALANEAGFVVDRWRVAVVPSASVVASRTATTPAAAALVVAIPDAAKLPPLPRSLEEAAVVRERLGGEVATLVGSAADEAAIARGIERYAVLHFASHALIDHAMPLRSALAVANGNGDGRLRAEEIYRLRVGADLVVLAACETGIGAATTGEGMMSLSRAFLHAGAGATISTLWPVADDSGPAFADALYRELARVPIVDAATAAKRELRAAGARPGDWAAYVVAASPTAAARVAANETPGEEPRSRWPWIAAALLAGALAVVLLRRRPGFAAVGAVATLAALVWIATSGRRAPEPEPRRLVATTRGAPGARVVARFADGALTWTPEAGVAYRATFHASDGRVLGEALAPGDVPAGAAWATIAAERDGLPVAQPALLRLR